MKQLIDILYKRGLITEQELHELNNEHDDISEEYKIKIQDIVNNMYHKENGTIYKGEKYTISQAKDIYDKWYNMIDKTYNYYDVYLIINAQFHDYHCLFNSWFTDCDEKIIETAIYFWMKDDDYKGNKIKDYFKL